MRYEQSREEAHRRKILSGEIELKGRKYPGKVTPIKDKPVTKHMKQRLESFYKKRNKEL